jgi:hypothetical protein
MSIIGDVLSLGADLLSSKSNKKALNQVAGYATQTRDTNNQLAGQARDGAVAAYQPYTERGDIAYNALFREAMGGPDWDAYLNANPDVAELAQREVQDGVAPDLWTSAQRHYEQFGKGEGRQLSQIQSASGPAPTYTRPDFGAAPTFARPDMPTLDLSTQNYRESPGYAFQQQRGMNALKSDKTLNGLLRSGAAVKSALDFSQGLADQDYNQWADRTTDNYRFEVDRVNRQFEADREYGTDVYRDTRDTGNQNFELDRGYGTDIWRDQRDTRNALLGGFADRGWSATQGKVNAGADYYGRVAGNNQDYTSTMSDVALGKAANRNATYAAIPKAYANIEQSVGSAFAGAAGGGAPASSYYMQAAANNFLRRS